VRTPAIAATCFRLLVQAASFQVFVEELFELVVEGKLFLFAA
jgi:hypothetical protein